MTKLKELLSGWKTYLTALSTVVAAAIAYSNGALADKELIAAIVGSILACTVKGATAKAENAAKDAVEAAKTAEFAANKPKPKAKKSKK